jgi:hypothetical protein
MPSYAIATLGAFAFDGTGGAAIVGDIEIGALPRTIVVAANALSTTPVQVNAYTSDFVKVKLPVKLSGIESQGETAPDHLARMLANLRTEVEKDTNTLTIAPWGMENAYTFAVYKNENFPVVIGTLTQARAVMRFDLTLTCLPV